MRRLLTPAIAVSALVMLAACAPAGGGASAGASVGASEAAGSGTLTVAAAETDAGTSLVGPDGMTLYIFTNDTDGTSTCDESCVGTWPPLILEEGAELEAGEGVSGELTTVERDDGTTQVVYDGQPLYFYAPDEAPGDSTGEGVGGVWFIASPDGQSGSAPSDESGAPAPSYDY